VNPVNEDNFGLLIAYVIPGFLAVLQLAQISPMIARWLAVPSSGAPTVGGFLYVTIASVGIGLGIGVLRWAGLDSLHRWMGLATPQWDFVKLQGNVEAFERMVQYHFRYYQFYGHTLIVLVVAAMLPQPLWGWLDASPLAAAVVALSLAVLLFAASRDALAKYQQRTAAFLKSTSHAQRAKV
jgi:hypothetical protein